jgi:hypothetical protein
VRRWLVLARAGAVKEQPFRYLVVIDLEATCDFCPEPIVDASVNSEIIEFPWVRHPTMAMRVCLSVGSLPLILCCVCGVCGVCVSCCVRRSARQVVLDTQTLEVVHEERYFVRPDFLEGVTPYCSALTGTQCGWCQFTR